uniref:Putative secreted protein n=1 Tax=Anopheles darlingi TaxID=43151 RepID=A0A2M4DG35_ANODA
MQSMARSGLVAYSSVSFLLSFGVWVVPLLARRFDRFFFFSNRAPHSPHGSESRATGFGRTYAYETNERQQISAQPKAFPITLCG